MSIRSICVFCGSRIGARPEYLEAARALGTELGRRGLTLVYGGTSVGLMGAVADAVLAEGGQVVGVLPHLLQSREIAHKNLTELHLVDSMHTRKAMMAERADAFIAMPGGVGTFEELFEITTWAQLGLHHKPIGLLNVADFYGPLLALMRRAVEEGFILEARAQPFVHDASPVALLESLLKAEQPLTPATPVLGPAQS
ncbi:Lysine decarboxylase family [Cystobacter fuscus DSM 2262]|uniref:Cytokinin riboside 5'-monophosphate phosphoribohydrolase n=1 Tax=Cystobacter fuscus (strain ATCC 25194 / DSM 2262 / NBRC 100088 / M29) TaxID=1242864 RepID=S9NYT8_CYSF2|nr:TIGR00730 family Rossman fold protein [Cystobacter fuscus]EPX55167.1 Lysine decarboxylase family [Cystobacter fuscus DSM 2262]